MKSKTITVREAAERMGKSETFVREGLARGLLPFGTGFSISGGKRTFFIPKDRFEKYMSGEMR